MKEFIFTHWASILAVVLFVAAVIVLAVFGKKKVIYNVLYKLVTEAEKTHGSGEGKAKFAEVAKKFYDMLPPIVRSFVTYGTMQKWIEEALKAAKEKWMREGGIK